MSERTNEECRLIITTEVVECLSGILNARHRDISLGAVLLVKKNWRIPEIRVSSMRKRERTDLPCRRTVLDGIKRKTSKFTFSDEAQHTRGDCSRRSGPIGYYRRSLLFVLDFRDFSKEVLYMVIAELCSIPFWFWKLTRKVIEYLLASPRWNNLSNRTTIIIEFLVGLHKSQNKFNLLRVPLQPQNTIFGFISELQTLLCPEQNDKSLDAITRVILFKSGSGMTAMPQF